MAEQVRSISTFTVHHSPLFSEEKQQQQCHLNPLDLSFLSIPYHQKGLLFPNPSSPHHHHQPPIDLLHRSLSTALDHFHPLAGRLSTTHHNNDGTTSFFIDCNNHGAQLVHAAAPGVCASDILSPIFKPIVLRSFFPLNGAVGHDGHSLPLLAVQVTELRDAIFIGVSANHCAVDGTSLWHFINSWSEISRREGVGATSLPAVLDRWFPPPLHSPIHLPLPHDPNNFIKRPTKLDQNLKEVVFHFSKDAIAELTATANNEMGSFSGEISSLESVLGHFWQSTTRARNLHPDETTIYVAVIDFREQLHLPRGYFGNAQQTPVAVAKAGDLLNGGPNSAARILHKSITSQTDATARAGMESWVRNPSLRYVGGFGPGGLFTAGSPAFDVYGNDFGWGGPVAVRSGGEVGRFDGRTAVFPAREGGGMDLEVCLPSQVLEALVEDKEFMDVAAPP